MKSQAGTGPVPLVRPSSVAKRGAVLAAAEATFLASGYDSVTMEDIAHRAGVSKQTVYTYFGSKDELFVELVGSMTGGATAQVHGSGVEIVDAEALVPALVDLLDHQLATVLTTRLLRLRRLVIAEADRFPALARSLAEHGPHRAIAVLAELLAELDRRGVLRVPEPRSAASQLNWLVMGEPVNDAMLLGEDSVPDSRARRAHVAGAVATFVAAYRC